MLASEQPYQKLDVSTRQLIGLMLYDSEWLKCSEGLDDMGRDGATEQTAN